MDDFDEYESPIGCAGISAGEIMDRIEGFMNPILYGTQSIFSDFCGEEIDIERIRLRVEWDDKRQGTFKVIEPDGTVHTGVPTFPAHEFEEILADIMEAIVRPAIRYQATANQRGFPIAPIGIDGYATPELAVSHLQAELVEKDRSPDDFTVWQGSDDCAWVSIEWGPSRAGYTIADCVDREAPGGLPFDFTDLLDDFD